MHSIAQISEAFYEDLRSAAIIQSKSLTQRFIASLLTKRFVILTGLAGSGKTKLAQAFALWMDGAAPVIPANNLFRVGDKVAADRATYNVDAIDSLSVQFSNIRDDGRTIKVTLPLELIMEWVQAIQIQEYDRQTSARTIRDRVAETTRYSTQLNSFETHLKAGAFHVLAHELLAVPDQPRSSTVPAYTVVAVGADWHNSEPILGYPDALNPQRYIRTPALDLIIRATSNPSIPHFLILDEMNLSHIERYFADVLSSIESGESIHLYDSLHGSQLRDGVPPFLPLPSNLFIIGTVNVDETTYLFSPKVLDRANSIEFRVAQEEIDRFIDAAAPVHLGLLSSKGQRFASAFLHASSETPPLLDTVNAAMVNTELKSLFRMLSGFGLEFGYRSAYEMSRFIQLYVRVVPDGSIYDALDAQVYQKILPRLNGSRSSLDPVLSTLADYCKTQRPNEQGELYPLSLLKIERMRLLLRQNGFTSFAEA